MFLYMVERIVREIRGRLETYISKVVQHPSKVVEIQIKKPSMKYKPGQYLFLYCAEISPFEWHPFTISSAPEEDFVSVHVRVVGDFTTALSKRLGCKFEKDDDSPIPPSLPRVMIDGPFGSASEDVFKYEVTVLVGAGIGVTPFSSILKSVWYRLINPNTMMKMRKCYFFWICRDTNVGLQKKKNIATLTDPFHILFIVFLPHRLSSGSKICWRLWRLRMLAISWRSACS